MKSPFAQPEKSRVANVTKPNANPAKATRCTFIVSSQTFRQRLYLFGVKANIWRAESILDWAESFDVDRTAALIPQGRSVPEKATKHRWTDPYGAFGVDWNLLRNRGGLTRSTAFVLSYASAYPSADTEHLNEKVEFLHSKLDDLLRFAFGIVG
jgi:hypothetical protein